MTGLTLGHAQFALAPAQVVERQGQDGARAQAIRGDQQADRGVAYAHGGGALDGIEKRTHAFPRPGPRELLKTAAPRGVDVPVHLGTASTRERAKAQASAERGDGVLEGGATVLVAKAREEDLDVVRLKRLKGRRALLAPDLIEQP